MCDDNPAFRSRIAMEIPTFFGHVREQTTANSTEPEFGPPFVEVSMYRQEGVRIIMHTPGIDDDDQPDIHIERRPRGWAIFLHPEGSNDPSGFIYFLDDGRSFVVPNGPEPLVIREWNGDVPEVDGLA